MVLIIIAITITITGLLLFIPPLTNFFEFETLNISQLFSCIGIGFTSVIWYELVKIKTRKKAIWIDSVAKKNNHQTDGVS